MGLLHNLKLRFSPPRINDPDFGPLTFMYISNAPERSYWEGEWIYPRTGKSVSISLDGGESGPLPEARQFYLSLPERFDRIITTVRPKLAEVFKTRLQQDLPEDIFSVLALSGFGIETPIKSPVCWFVDFETTGEKWLGIEISFEDEIPVNVTVDT